MKTGEITYKIDDFHSATFPELRVGATYRLTVGGRQAWGDDGGMPFTGGKIAALTGMDLSTEDRETLAAQMNAILEEAMAIREPHLSRALHRLTGANGREIGQILVETPGLLPPERVGHRELTGASECYMGPLRRDGAMYKVDLPDGRTFFGLLAKRGPVWEAVHDDLLGRGALPGLAAAVATLVKRAHEKAERTGKVVKTYSKLEISDACVTIEAPYIQPITNNEKKENDMNHSDTITLTPEEAEAAYRSIIEPAATEGNGADSLYSFIEREYPRLRAIREAEGLTMRALYKRIPRGGKGKSLSYRSFTTYYYRIAKARALAEEKASQEALVGGEGNQPNRTTFVQSGFNFSMDLRRVKGDDPQALINIFPDWIAKRRAEKENAFLEDFIRDRELVIQPWGIESGDFCTSDAVLVASELMRAFLVTRGTCEGDLRVDVGLRIHDMEGGLAEWLDSDQHPENDLMDHFTSRSYHIFNGLFLPERLYEDEKREVAEKEPAEPMPVKEQTDESQRGYDFEMRVEDISLPALPLPDCEDDAYDTLAARFQTWLEDDLDYNNELLDAIHEKSIITGDFGIRSGSFCPASAFETAVNTMGRFIYEIGGAKAGLTFEAEIGKYRNGKLLGMRGRPYLFRIENRRCWRPVAAAADCKEIDHVPA